MTAPQAYRFSRHARHRMRRDRLAETDIIAIMTNPDRVTLSERDRLNAWKRRGDKWLRVTYRQERGRTIIVTVTLRRKGPGR